MQVVKVAWCWCADGLRADVALELDDGRVRAVVPGDRWPEIPTAPRSLALPGLVNAHSHAFQRAFRGHVQWRAEGRDDFWSWRDRMYATANELTPEGVEAVSALAFLEMAEAGVTSVGEFHYLHHAPDGARYADPDELARRVIAAAERVGIRICLLRTAYLRAGPGRPLRPDQRRFGDVDADEVLAAIGRLGSAAGPTVTVGLAPHSVRAVDPDTLRALAAFRGVVHAHVSEQPAENEQCAAENGCSPLALLDRCGLLSERLVAVHLTHPMPGDEQLLIDAGAAVCVCPSTELDLGDGLLPLSLRQRARACLGSDSHAVIDPWSELRTLELHGRAQALRRNVLAPEGQGHGLAERLLRAATAEGARALGGSAAGISPGAPADLVVLDLDRVAADGVPPLEAAAFVATPEWVREVWVAGRRVVDGGRHPSRDDIRAAAAPFLPR
ncbi:MAG: formimidoylglutamate deiminase [Myxococcota bacterium]